MVAAAAALGGVPVGREHLAAVTGAPAAVDSLERRGIVRAASPTLVLDDSWLARLAGAKELHRLAFALARLFRRLGVEFGSLGGRGVGRGARAGSSPRPDQVRDRSQALEDPRPNHPARPHPDVALGPAPAPARARAGGRRHGPGAGGRSLGAPPARHPGRRRGASDRGARQSHEGPRDSPPDRRRARRQGDRAEPRGARRSRAAPAARSAGTEDEPR